MMPPTRLLEAILGLAIGISRQVQRSPWPHANGQSGVQRQSASTRPLHSQTLS
jgi:hypothetical protein